MYSVETLPQRGPGGPDARPGPAGSSAFVAKETLVVAFGA
jgi:hypothetical protein